MLNYTHRFPQVPSASEKLTAWCQSLLLALNSMYRKITDELNATPRLVIKTTTGDPTEADEGTLAINTVDSTVKIYADSAWRQLASW